MMTMVCIGDDNSVIGDDNGGIGDDKGDIGGNNRYIRNAIGDDGMNNIRRVWWQRCLQCRRAI